MDAPGASSPDIVCGATRSRDVDTIASLPPCLALLRILSMVERQENTMNMTEDGAQMAPGAPTNGASTPANKPPARRRRAPNRRRTETENATQPAETQPEAPTES